MFSQLEKINGDLSRWPCVSKMAVQTAVLEDNKKRYRRHYKQNIFSNNLQHLFCCSTWRKVYCSAVGLISYTRTYPTWRDPIRLLRKRRSTRKTSVAIIFKNVFSVSSKKKSVTVIKWGTHFYRFWIFCRSV